MAILPTNLGEKFASKTLKKFWEKSITPILTNQEYEGDLKGGGADRVTILQFLNNVGLSNYASGTAMATEKWLGDVESQLLVDQQKYFNFEIDNLDKFEAYVNDLDSNLLENAANVLAETIDAYVLGLYTEVKAGHRVGSDFNSATIVSYNPGTATVTTGTGAVTIGKPGITFRERDVVELWRTNGGLTTTTLTGLGVSFDSGVTWYKISTWTDSVTFTITDWNDSTYTGGTKTAVEFIIEACYPKVVSKTTIYADICDLKTKLD